MASHDHRLISVVIPPLRWRWQGLLHFPMFILTTQTFLESDPIPFITGNLSDASLEVAFEMDMGGGKKSLCLKLAMSSREPHQFAVLQSYSRWTVGLHYSQPCSIPCDGLLSSLCLCLPQMAK